MPFSEAYEVDRLRAKLPRSYRALYDLYPRAWQEMLSAVEQAIDSGKTASVLIGKLSILRGLDRDVRRWVLLSVQADRREVLWRQQKSFLTELHERSLDDLLAELRVVETKARAAMRAMPVEGRDQGRVFISHHANSGGATALALAEAMEKQGMSCWLAPRDIPLGSVWPWEAYGAVQRCTAQVVLLTEPALKSKAVAGEVAIAVARDVPIAVVRLFDADPAAINPALAAYQHAQDWIERPFEEIGLLARRLERFLGEAVLQVDKDPAISTA